MKSMTDQADRPPEPPSHVHFDELYCGQCGDWNTLDEIEGHLLSEGRETPAHARLVSIEAASPPSATEAERMRRALVEADLVWDWGREGAIARARITDFARTVAEKYAALGASRSDAD